jgi:hypothetical protein
MHDGLQLDHKPRCCHEARPRPTNHQTKLNRIAAKDILRHMKGFIESVFKGSAMR